MILQSPSLALNPFQMTSKKNMKRVTKLKFLSHWDSTLLEAFHTCSYGSTIEGKHDGVNQFMKKMRFQFLNFTFANTHSPSMLQVLTMSNNV